MSKDKECMYCAIKHTCEKHDHSINQAKDCKELEEVRVELECSICGDKYLGFEPETCCSGFECGCGGEPSFPLCCEKKECNHEAGL